MTVLIIGICLILLGLLLLLIRRRTERKLIAISYAREAKVSDLQSEFGEVGQDLGKGYYKQLIALHGTVESDKPLVSELANQHCVKYRMLVERNWEEMYEEEDDDGNIVEKTRTGYDTLSSNERQQPFYVNDGTGSIRVSSEGADVELEKVLDKYEPVDRADFDGTISIGNLSINLDLNLSSRRNILGYRYKEWILPVGRKVFIHGEVNDSSGELSFEKPSDPDKKEPYIISLKSKSELIRQAAQKLKTLRFFIYGCLGIGVVLSVWGILRIL